MADIAHRYAPIAVIGGVLGWALLSGLGWPPEGAALIMALATIPAGVLLAVRSAPVRRRTMALATCCFAARPQDRDLAELDRFEALAGAIEGAADARRSGAIDDEAFLTVWRAVYAEVDARSTALSLPRRPSARSAPSVPSAPSLPPALSNPVDAAKRSAASTGKRSASAGKRSADQG